MDAAFARGYTQPASPAMGHFSKPKGLRAREDLISIAFAKSLSTMPDDEGTSMTLQLFGDASGLKHYLAGKPVRSGDTIEVLVLDRWIKARYEWSGDPGNDAFGIIIETNDTTVTITPNTLVRWPMQS
jgi:hypothetical protein